jgi:hypothetical protein
VRWSSHRHSWRSGSRPGQRCWTPRRNEDEIPLGDLRILDEGTVGSHEHHPNRGGLGERKRLRLPDDGMVRNEDDFAIGPVVVQREGRDDVDFVTCCKAAHVLAYSIDDARSLVAETCRKLLDGLDVVIDATWLRRGRMLPSVIGGPGDCFGAIPSTSAAQALIVGLEPAPWATSALRFRDRAGRFRNRLLRTLHRHAERSARRVAERARAAGASRFGLR